MPPTELYNATIVDVIEVHTGLRRLRIRPDAGRLSFTPGQYTVLGLGNWEACTPGSDSATTRADEPRKLIKRAYSFSSRMLNDAGEIERAEDAAETEFYITLVPGTEEHVAGLTPRLFALRTGDRLFMGPHAKGHYTLAPVHENETVIFAATGTGEAPHNAMLAELLSRGHTGPIVSLVCVRRLRDLGYLETHRRLERRFGNYRYVPLTTREPENIDATLPNYVGKQYLQHYFESGAIDKLLEAPLLPDCTHVYLCGNPAMLGLPRRSPEGIIYPPEGGMAETLARRGFILDEPGYLGHVHFEKYW